VAIYARGGAQFDADKELRASKSQLLELLRAVRDQQTTDRGRVFKIGLREWVFDEQDETCCVGKLRQSGKTATPKNLQVRRRRLAPRQLSWTAIAGEHGGDVDETACGHHGHAAWRRRWPRSRPPAEHAGAVWRPRVVTF
jgi:hypothetical protein